MTCKHCGGTQYLDDYLGGLTCRMCGRTEYLLDATLIREMDSSRVQPHKRGKKYSLANYERGRYESW